ncbi:hypothetical protein [Methylobacterium tarhaniae]|uniref:hypothetical protein n=1 Tax=Methylobacterium tarhaniae TaxID=1187852 RepID=UPI003D0798B7
MAYGDHTTKIRCTNSERSEKPQGVGPVTAAIRAVRTEPEPARRGTLRALAALPLAVAALTGPAAAPPSPDAAFIRTCNEALAYWDEIDARAISEDWDDVVVGQHVDRLNGMLDIVIATTPASRAGQAAKARVVAKEVETYCTEKDRTTQLVESLLRDLTDAAKLPHSA